MPGRLASGVGARRTEPRNPPADPLPLQLPAPSPLPGRIRPEQPVPCAEPFDSPDWRFSVEWSGSRALLFAAEGGGARLQAETLADLTPRFPEVAAAGRDVLRRPAVLDGTIAVLDPTGRPDLDALGVRLATGAATAGELPAVFLVTDVLHMRGTPTMAWELDRRLDTIAGLVESGTTIQVPDHVVARGGALAAAAAGRGLSALLARRAGAPYRPGVASPDRLRIELTPQADCAVVGVEPTRQSPVGRLLLAEHAGGRLIMAGRVAAPRERRIDEWLQRQVRALRVAAPPVAPDAPAARTTWLRPQLVATVAHAGRDARGVLREPSLLVVRDDIDPAWCVRRLPQAAPQEGGRASFVPTVLVPLPLDDAVLVPRARR